MANFTRATVELPEVKTRNPWVAFARRRLLRFAISLWVVVTAAFSMIHLIPGDPVRAALGPTAPASLVDARRHSLGLDDPMWLQYAHFLRGIFTARLGTSLTSGLPVWQMIRAGLPPTLELAGLAFVVAILLSVPAGLLMAALTRGGRRRGAELAFTSTSSIFAALPEFLLAVGLVYLFGVRFAILPVADRGGPTSFVLPVLALALGPAAVLARIMRVETLSVLRNNYVRTARAKRLPARLIYVRHVLPNALTATLTLGGLLLTSLVAGTVLVESVFAWPGLGTTIVRSIVQKDYPVVEGIVLVYGVIVLLINLLVDVLLALLDPRSTIGES